MNVILKIAFQKLAETKKTKIRRRHLRPPQPRLITRVCKIVFVRWHACISSKRDYFEGEFDQIVGIKGLAEALTKHLRINVASRFVIISQNQTQRKTLESQ